MHNETLGSGFFHAPTGQYQPRSPTLTASDIPQEKEDDYDEEGIPFESSAEVYTCQSEGSAPLHRDTIRQPYCNQHVIKH